MTADERVAVGSGWAKPWAIRFAAGPLLGAMRLLHRPRLEGLSKLPQGPFLLVANHSAGIGASELMCFGALWAKQVNGVRPLAGFAHAVGFRVKPLAWLWDQLGVIPSTYEAAYEALERGVPVLIFPGGDHETLRPVWQARQVDLGGRRGFLRIARTAGVPIVPMGIRGSHYTAPMLYRAEWLATALVVPRFVLGIKRWGLSLLGVVVAALWLGFGLGALPWRLLVAYLWLSCPLIFWPIIPATLSFHVGEPLEAAQLFDQTLSEEAQLEEALQRVQGELARLVRGRA